MEVVFSNRAYTSVLTETTEKIKTETGGLFLGAIRDNVWYIVEAIDPGPNSVFEVAYFEYDQAYTQHLIRKIANLYSSKLDLIGLWHRHPGSFDSFSSTDDRTNAKYAAMRNEGAISALVNVDPGFRITMYHVAQPCRYSKIKYTVGDESIPQDLLHLKSQEQLEKLMQNLLSPDKCKDNKYHQSASFGEFMRAISNYFGEVACNEIFPESEMEATAICEKLLDVMMEDITFFMEEVDLEVSLSQRDKSIVMVQESIDEAVRVYFTYFETEDVVIFKYNGKCFFYSSGFFKKTFIRFVADQRRKGIIEQSGKYLVETGHDNIANTIKFIFGWRKQ